MRFKVQIEIDKILTIDNPKLTTKVGRSTECEVVIPLSSVSRQHCQIQSENGKHFITDLGSYNGTFIDGLKIEPHLKTEFDLKSIITIGHVLLQVSAIPDHNSKTEIDNANKKKNRGAGNVQDGRLELCQPSLTLEMEKKKQVIGPKNPTSAHFKSSYTQKNNSIFSYLFLLSGLGILGAFYYFYLR